MLTNKENYSGRGKPNLILIKFKCLLLSHVQLFVTPQTLQGLLSMEFSRQAYWSGLPSPSPGDLPNPGIESESPELQVYFLPSEPPRKPYSE